MFHGLQSAAHIPRPFRLSGWAQLQCWEPKLIRGATCLHLGEGVGGVSTPRDPLCTLFYQPPRWACPVLSEQAGPPLSPLALKPAVPGPLETKAGQAVKWPDLWNLA